MASINYPILDYSIFGLTLRPVKGISMGKSIHTADYDRFRAELRARREDAGLTQVELAEQLGWTQTMVSKCELGERRLDLIETRRWCHATGSTLLDLVSDLEPRLSRQRKSRRS